METRNNLALAAGIAKKVCILASFALLITHPAVQSNQGLSFADSEQPSWQIDGSGVEQELLRLWAYGGLVNTSADPWFGVDRTLDEMFAFESLAGPSPDFYTDGTGRLVKRSAVEGASAASGRDLGAASSVPRVHIDRYRVRDLDFATRSMNAIYMLTGEPPGP